jgi:hypothetical protein
MAPFNPLSRSDTTTLLSISERSMATRTQSQNHIHDESGSDSTIAKAKSNIPILQSIIDAVTRIQPKPLLRWVPSNAITPRLCENVSISGEGHKKFVEIDRHHRKHNRRWDPDTSYGESPQNSSCG